MAQGSAPLVSVVVPTYQHAPYIRTCIEGILCQKTEFPIEILIGDDGSTDGTREICECYAREHPGRIRAFLRERIAPPTGHPPGRDNVLALLRACRGEFIARCDGDDYWTDPHKLQRQVNCLREDPEASGCFDRVQVVVQPGDKLGKVYGEHGTQTRFRLEDTFSQWAICHPSGFLYRRSALPSLPEWFDTVPSLDMAMFALVASKGSLVCIPVVTGVYRKHDGGITTTSNHLGVAHHRNRILLWVLVGRHLRHAQREHSTRMFRAHWASIVLHCTPRQRLQHLLFVMKTAPGWFLRKPVFTLGRLRDAVRP